MNAGASKERMGNHYFGRDGIFYSHLARELLRAPFEYKAQKKGARFPNDRDRQRKVLRLHADQSIAISCGTRPSPLCDNCDNLIKS